MPKIVDPAVRRQEVADAVFRVVARDGVAEASLRNVADEAGLAIGSVRHYCGTHQELMATVLVGLAIRGISAEALPPERAMTVLNRHLDSIVDLG